MGQERGRCQTGALAQGPAQPVLKVPVKLTVIFTLHWHPIPSSLMRLLARLSSSGAVGPGHMDPPARQCAEKEDLEQVGSPRLLEPNLGSDGHHSGIIELSGEGIRSSCPSPLPRPPHTRTHVHTHEEGIARGCKYQKVGITGSPYKSCRPQLPSST